jgi:glycosyltransferase involved in cell wall biosynthesis
MVGTPIAMTIHDLIPTLFPEYWKGWNPHRDRGSIVTKASVIFVPSEVTKVDLLEFEGELHCEIIVVPHGVNPKIFTTNSDDKVRRIDFPYFLFIGRRSRYKRFGLLLEALSNVRLRGHDVGLVIVGGGRLSHDEKSLVGAALPGDRFCHESSSDYGLAQLLRQAEALCFPSKIEGFGLPILEAMACGCPCVLSDIPIFREVSGNSALFFDSESVESLTQEMIQIISDLRLRETLVKVGTTRAESLTWRRAAETVASGYRSIL